MEFPAGTQVVYKIVDGERDEEVVERLKCWVRKLKTQGDEWPMSISHAIYQHNAKAETLYAPFSEYALS